jgi:hypothetical protein
MDRRTTGGMTDRADSGKASFNIPTSFTIDNDQRLLFQGEFASCGPEWTRPHDCTSWPFYPIRWAGWSVSFPFVFLPYVNQHSITVNLFWLLTFDLFFVVNFFSTLTSILPTGHPPSYPTDLNLNLAYELTINPFLTLAKLLSLLD